MEFDGNENVVTTRPCNDCPWRRNATPGWLGPMTANEWVTLAHSDEPIACHQTITEDNDWLGVFQCAGAANYRRNICKLPRDPGVARGETDENVFASPVEFIEYHT